MTTQFTEISFDYNILDRFNCLCDFELWVQEQKFNIFDRQFKEFVFEEDLDFENILKNWVEKAHNYFKDEYLENIGTPDKEDLERQKLYLQELQLITKYRLRKGE